MSLNVRNIPDAVAYAMVAANNQRIADSIGSFFHMSQTEDVSADYRNPVLTRVRITSANSSSEATAVALVNEIKADLNKHFADDIAHDTAVSAQITTADAVTGDSLVTALALANAIKAALNTHYAAANVHFTNDGTNTISAANATDQTSLNTLLNEIKTDLNAHFASAPAGTWLKIVSA
jgi:hypothetical protein